MKKIALYFTCFILLFTLTGCGEKKQQEEKPKKEENQAIVIEDQTVNDLSFESFNIVIDEQNVSHIYFEVVNNGEVSNNASNVTFTLYQDNVNVLSLTKSLNGPIDSGDVREINAAIDVDLSKVNKVEYSIS